MADDDLAALGGVRNALLLVVAAVLAGVATGFVGGAFRKLLSIVGNDRNRVIAWAHHAPDIGWLLPVVAVALFAALARLIVRWVPEAMGSGIQNVEAAYRRTMPNTDWSAIPAKFVGGILSIGAGGLALGREGPTVQMGAAFGARIGALLGLSDSDCRLMQTALGGAGLGVAFNAPFGGSLLAFEEVTRKFTIRLSVITLIGSATAITCSRVVLGNHPNFHVAPLPDPAGWTIVIFVALGALTGLLGAFYNRLVLALLDLLGRLRGLPPEARAGLVGAIVGAVLWFQPLAAGGGDALVDKVLAGHLAVLTLLAYVVVRGLIAPVSYAAQTPGGLFAPLLALGATWGALFEGILGPLLPSSAKAPGTFAIVGMTALFAAVVRAPLTGVALLTEMTATTTLLVPMLAASFAAVLVASLVHSPPIYDSLKERIPRELFYDDPPGADS